MILVGNGHFAQQYLQDIQANPHMGFTMDGYVSGEARPGLGKRLGSYEELEEILEHSDLGRVDRGAGSSGDRVYAAGIGGGG